MSKKIHATLASFAVISALAFVAPETTAGHDGHQRATSHVRRRATKARKRVKEQSVSYVCPMHPDMRSHSRGECPKCGMELVSKQRGAKGS